MSLINNDRDMKKLLDDLRVGEFSARDLQAIALHLPVSVLAAALYANAGAESFTRAGTPDQKADVIARLLHSWVLNPELRLGELITAATIRPGACDNDLDFVEDSDLVRALESYPPKKT